MTYSLFSRIEPWDWFVAVRLAQKNARIVSEQGAWIMAYGLGLVAEGLSPSTQSAPISHTFSSDRLEIV